ncbi:MAG: GNAT family N-acetyltransferase [Candidatus Eisenbacteria bacterium]|nr:GNAT family N-acetyltransferase [Candidatus Latescibacterota bacterium]MBD3301415.1 GNAT family N-acetyltransferase [Candidatus Eisenbacteria bacterium]
MHARDQALIRSRSDSVGLRWLETPHAVLSLGGHWDRLLDEWGTDCVFLRWDWIRTWLRVYGSRLSLLVGLVTEEEEPIGLAPLFLARERVVPFGPRLRAVRMIGDGPLCPDHLVLPCAPGREEPFAEALFAALHRRRSEWDRIELRDLEGRDPAWRAFAERAAAAGLPVRISERTFCPFVPLPDTWEDYLARLGSKTRSTIRQRMRKLERSFAVEWSDAAGIEEVDRSLAVLEELHARAWGRRGRTGVFADPQFRAFHRIHARRAFRSGRLWLTTMRADGRDAGATLCFVDRAGAHGYQLGHDPALRKFGVGMLMIVRSIRSSIERGLPEMDFLRGAGPYKFHLADRVRRGHDLTIHRGTAADRLGRGAERGRRGTAALVRRLAGQRGKQWLKDRLRRR